MVRFEHVRTLFNNTSQSQESKSPCVISEEYRARVPERRDSTEPPLCNHHELPSGESGRGLDPGYQSLAQIYRVQAREMVSGHWVDTGHWTVLRKSEALSLLNIPLCTGPPRCRGLFQGIASPAVLCQLSLFHKEPARNKLNIPKKY